MKKLDLTPSDQSDFGSSTNGSVPSGGKTSYPLPVGVREGDSKKGSRSRHLPLQLLEALQMEPTVIIITVTAAVAICWAPCVPDTKLKCCVDIISPSGTHPMRFILSLCTQWGNWGLKKTLAQGYTAVKERTGVRTSSCLTSKPTLFPPHWLSWARGMSSGSDENSNLQNFSVILS